MSKPTQTAKNCIPKQNDRYLSSCSQAKSKDKNQDTCLFKVLSPKISIYLKMFILMFYKYN